ADRWRVGAHHIESPSAFRTAYCCCLSGRPSSRGCSPPQCSCRFGRRGPQLDMRPLTAPLQTSKPSFDTHMSYWHDRVMSAAMPLRQQQARQLRTAVLEAVIAKLEGAAPDDVSNERAARPG